MAKTGENKNGEVYAEILEDGVIDIPQTESNIESVSKINPQNINPANFFMTLTTEAAAVGILSESEILNMQSQISDMLADIIWQYNGGASTSVTTETASDFIESVVFTLDCFCISVTGGETCDISSAAYERCVEMLRGKSGIKNCHAKGAEYIPLLVNQAKDLYKDLYVNKLSTGISIYNITINKSVAVFFQKYNMRFFAHDIPSSNKFEKFFEYFLALSSEIKEYKGILYVGKYLRYILLENEFCALFDIKDVQRLMKLCANNNGFVVSELMDNIFEKVFANVFFYTLLDSDNISLFIKQEQYSKIAEIFYENGKCRDEMHITGLVHEHIQKLIRDLKITNAELCKYILNYQNIFTGSILFAAQKDYLHNLITYDI